MKPDPVLPVVNVPTVVMAVCPAQLELIEATTAPVVGEMVRDPSELATEATGMLAVVSKVPEVGKVTLVLPVKVPVKVYAPLKATLPPTVMVFVPLLTPVPPYVPTIVDACQTPVVMFPADEMTR